MVDETPSVAIPWQEMLETLFRHRVRILGLTAIGLGAAVAVEALSPAIYKAQAKILLTAKPVAGTRNAMPDKQIQAELELLKSPSLIRDVLAGYTEDGIPTPEDPDPELIAGRIESEARSNVVQISYTDRDPEWAARFVNDLLDQHVAKIASLNDQINAQTFYENQLGLASERWSEAREQLTAFREQQGTTLLSGDVNALKGVLAQLESEAVAAETRVLQLEAKAEYLSRALHEHPETVAAETRVMESDAEKALKSRILDLEIERSELLSRYTPTSTFVREIDRQIEESRRLLTDQDGSILSETMTEANPAFQALLIDLVTTEAELTESRAQISALSAQMARYKSKLGELERASAELDRLESELQSAKEAVENYRRMEEEARLATAMDESRIVNVIIVDKALKPLKPEPRKPQILLAAGALAGLFLGTAWAFARDWLDPTVKSTAQALRLAGVPLIGEIPLR